LELNYMETKPTALPPANAGHPSTRSLKGLDGINLLMADVRDGVGPYLSVFLKGGEHWDSGAIGIAMAAFSIAAAVCQIPAGLLVDETRAKRLLIAGCALVFFAVLMPETRSAYTGFHAQAGEPGADAQRTSA